MEQPLASSTTKGNRRSQNHNVEHDGKETDIIILVIGPTGAGKSTFINEAINEERLTVGGGMKLCTTQPCPVVIDTIPGFPSLQGRRLVLVDTPGFNNAELDDTEIQTRISKWLKKSYGTNMSIGGVLYLHDISLKIFTDTDSRNLNTVWQLCREATVTRKPILATTYWGPPTPKDGEIHEKELKTKYWKTMITSGVKVHRFQRNSTSAWDIISDLLLPHLTGSGGSATGQKRPRDKRRARCVVQ